LKYTDTGERGEEQFYNTSTIYWFRESLWLSIIFSLNMINSRNYSG